MEDVDLSKFNQIVPVRDYEGLYSVTDCGQVISFHGKKPRILKQGIGGSGYPDGYSMVVLAKDGTTKSTKVSVIVAESFIRRREENEVILHLNNIKTDNRLENLKIGTQAENIQQKYKEGYIQDYMRGEKHHGAKLSKEDVRSIRERAKSERQIDLAHEYNVTKGTIHHVVSFKNWSWLD